MSELTAAERKQLRLARFGGGQGSMPGIEAATTIDALKIMEEQKRKKLERAERFGIVTKEVTEQRIKNRQERFGIETKESMDVKKQERMKRFGQMTEPAALGTSEEVEAKRKARMERFGANEVQEAQRTVSDGGFKLNRRKQKAAGKQGDKDGKRSIVVDGNNKRQDKQGKGGNRNRQQNKSQKPQKRFKKGGNRD